MSIFWAVFSVGSVRLKVNPGGVEIELNGIYIYIYSVCFTMIGRNSLRSRKRKSVGKKNVLLIKQAFGRMNEAYRRC